MSKGAQIDAAVVKRIAELAHLNLTPDEVSFYRDHLQKILAYVDQLNDVEVPPVPDDELATPERIDQVSESLDAAVAVAQAQVQQGTSFRVPRIIE